ncbi:MAG: transporter substrate-binding domain-containing protein [Synergistaceae bacterium]|nr:transporter substrate-binding domain-containing protein [Synergistaceae bacterium]
MKKYLLLFMLITAALLYNYLAAPKTKPVLRIGVECDHVPYNWETGTPNKDNFPLANNPGFYADGYDVQIAAMIAARLEAQPEFYKIPFDNLIGALNRGEIDAIFSGMVDTEDRKQSIDFTIPYEMRKTEYAALVHIDSKYIAARSIRELRGARMMAQSDSRFDEVIDQIPDVIHLPAKGTQAEVISELLKFSIDGTVLNYDTALSYARNHKEFRAVRFSEGNGFDLGFTGLCAGLRKGDEEMLENFNRMIEDIPMRQRLRIMDRAIIRAGDDLN